MRLTILLASLSLLCACGGGGGTSAPTVPPPATTCPIPVAKASPSWKTDLYPAIQSSCGSAATSCHQGPSPTGHVVYSGTSDQVYAQLVGVVPASAPAGYFRVAPGDLAHSWILEKVTKDNPGGGYGARMPYAAPNLCQPTVDTLSAWISAGAHNN
jgi:ABC-type transport system substrate-binding protein